MAYNWKFKNKWGAPQVTNIDIATLVAMVVSTAALCAVGVNIWMVKKTAQDQTFQYLRDRKITAYSEMMTAFEEVCDANVADDNERKQIAETALNGAIAIATTHQTVRQETSRTIRSTANLRSSTTDF